MASSRVLRYATFSVVFGCMGNNCFTEFRKAKQIAIRRSVQLLAPMSVLRSFPAPFVAQVQAWNRWSNFPNLAAFDKQVIPFCGANTSAAYQAVAMFLDLTIHSFSPFFFISAAAVSGSSCLSASHRVVRSASSMSDFVNLSGSITRFITVSFRFSEGVGGLYQEMRTHPSSNATVFH